MKKRKVLIVEDNEKNMKLFSALLKINNFEVLEATDAESGLDILKTHVPSLILMDIQLPGMDGYAATRLIKEDPKFKNVPVVALTAYAMQGDEKKAEEAGCDGYISKPIETRSFLEKIEIFLNMENVQKFKKRDKTLPPKRKILVVDDEEKNQRLLEAMISNKEFEIVKASDGEEGIQKVHEELPDVILLDVMMPKKDGFTVARELKEDPAVRDIPIILVTALDGSESRIQGLEAGAEEFLSKPVKKIELLARIRSMLQLKEYREQLNIRQKTEAIFVKEVTEGDTDRLELKDSPVVLLVEDNEVDAGIIRKVLEQEPIHLEIVKSGEEAVSLIQSDRVDLVLLDILLPDINGFEICKRLKTMDVAKDIPIVVITCLDDMDSKITGVKLGADDFLVKPINGRELRARIKVLLEKKDQLDQLRTHYEKALSSAIMDSLTGLYNHGYFKKFLGLETKRCLRHNYPVSLIMLDVDNFKEYNDTLGHSVGDGILQNLGILIRGVIREVDLTARYGGDEIAVILPYSDRSGAVKVAGRIQEAITSYDFLKDASNDMEALTVSIGIAEFPSDADTKDELIEKADSMLYAAKQKGKNQVCVSGDLEASREEELQGECRTEPR